MKRIAKDKITLCLLTIYVSYVINNNNVHVSANDDMVTIKGGNDLYNELMTQPNNIDNNSDISGTDKDSVTNYWQFHVGNFVNTYAPPIITIVGTIGNVLSVLVAMQKSNKNSSPAFYMAALAILDTVMLILGLFQYWLLFGFLPQLLSESHCHGMFFIVNFFSNYAAWAVVAMTFERVIAVTMPLKAPTLCRVKNARIVLLIIGGLSAVKNIHYAFTSDFTYHPKTLAAMCAFGLVRKDAFRRIWQWVDTVLSSLLPFAAILAANVIIIVNIRRQSSERAKMTTSEKPEEKNQQKSGDQGVTVMLMTVSFLFVVLTAPLFCFRLYFTFVKTNNDLYLQAVYNMGHHICHKLWYVNNAANFYVYCLTGRKFRQDFVRMFCPGSTGQKGNSRPQASKISTVQTSA